MTVTGSPSISSMPDHDTLAASDLPVATTDMAEALRRSKIGTLLSTRFDRPV